VLLSLKYNFLFVHIAKTGGTSVRAALQPLRWRDPMYLPQFICSRLSHMTGHRIGSKFPRHAKIIAAREMLPQDFFDGLFKFVFVRNPWDLQVSSWHHVQKEHPQLLRGIDSFAEFIRVKLDPERPYDYIFDTSIQLQSDFVKDLHGNVLVDFIGHYESLAEDFEEACRRIGIAPRPLPHKRKAASRDDYRRYYDDVTRDLVARHFSDDITTFGYEFE